MFNNKFEYSVTSNSNNVGTVTLTNPVSIGDAIKIGNKSYRVTDIWHSETCSTVYVELID